jgi:hypothetical protein
MPFIAGNTIETFADFRAGEALFMNLPPRDSQALFPE